MVLLSQVQRKEQWCPLYERLRRRWLWRSKPTRGNLGKDCDDEEPTIYIGIAYLESSEQCMQDKDGDGYGNNFDGEEVPTGVFVGTDCNDEDTYLYPSAAYLDDINACMRDVDGDGYGDSTDASISMGNRL